MFFKKGRAEIIGKKSDETDKKRKKKSQPQSKATEMLLVQSYYHKGRGGRYSYPDFPPAMPIRIYTPRWRAAMIELSGNRTQVIGPKVEMEIVHVLHYLPLYPKNVI